MTDSTHKTTAVALQNRRLVTVSKKGGTWRAEATDAGRYYTEHGTYPPPQPVEKRTHAPRPPVPETAASTAKAAGSATATPANPAKPKPEALVPVAERLSTRPHPAVARIKRENLLPFKPELRSRALRLLDALAKEAERRGHKVQSSVGRSDHLLTISVRGHTSPIAMREPTSRVDHIKTADEIRRAERTGYDWSPRYDYLPSGRLALKVGGYGDQFTEPKNGKWRLEERLDRVLEEVEGRAAAAEHREAERQREQAERQARWEKVRAEAEVALTQHHRATTLANQANQWRQHDLLSGYIAAMEAHIATLTGEPADQAGEWLHWSKTHLATLAPFTDLRLPPTPKPTPDALKPFMRGLSPYGPDSYL